MPCLAGISATVLGKSEQSGFDLHRGNPIGLSVARWKRAVVEVQVGPSAVA
jgi:hypothetical protein